MRTVKVIFKIDLASILLGFLQILYDPYYKPTIVFMIHNDNLLDP